MFDAEINYETGQNKWQRTRQIDEFLSLIQPCNNFLSQTQIIKE